MSGDAHFISTFIFLLFNGRDDICQKKRSSSPGAAAQNAGSPQEYICGAFSATPPLPWDSLQSSDWNQFSCLLLSLPSLPFTLLLLCSSAGFPQAGISRNPLRSHDGRESSIFSYLWRRLLTLSRICAQACHSIPGQRPLRAPGCLALFAFPHQRWPCWFSFTLSHVDDKRMQEGYSPRVFIYQWIIQFCMFLSQLFLLFLSVNFETRQTMQPRLARPYITFRSPSGPPLM